jgi:transposase
LVTMVKKYVPPATRDRRYSGILKIIQDDQSGCVPRKDAPYHLSYLQERIRVARKAIQHHIEEHSSLQSQQALLISIPSIGKLTAARLLAEIGDITAFEDASQLATYAGLNPKNSQSGSSLHKKAHMSKEGRIFLRYFLYMPAIVARKHNPIIMEFCKRLADRWLAEMAIVVAAMRKLMNIVFGVLKRKMPFDPDYGKQFPLNS